MKIAITGSSGMLGTHLVEFFKLKRMNILALDRNNYLYPNTNIKSEQIDLTNFKDLKKILDNFKPNIIINTAANINVDQCEVDSKNAENINGSLPNFINDHFYKTSKFIQISTDAVYGKNETPMKKEDDYLDPNNVYSKSKLMGENIFNNPNNLVVRTCPYGWSSKKKLTFAEWIFDSLHRKIDIFMFKDVYFSPIYVPLLVIYIEYLIINNFKGVFNVGGFERISKYDFAILLSKKLKISQSNIKVNYLKNQNFVAKRSKDLSMDSSKFFNVYKKKPLTLQNELDLFISHKDSEVSGRFNI